MPIKKSTMAVILLAMLASLAASCVEADDQSSIELGALPISGNPPLTVTFTTGRVDLGPDNMLSLNFGDGHGANTGTDRTYSTALVAKSCKPPPLSTSNPDILTSCTYQTQHTYAESGEYHAVLDKDVNIHGNARGAFVLATKIITIAGPPPKNATISAKSCRDDKNPGCMWFVGSGYKTSSGYIVNFGDGKSEDVSAACVNSSSIVSGDCHDIGVYHVYSSPGAYTATVFDPSSSQTVASLAVKVEP